MASTLLLDRTYWDLTIDVNGDIAMATEPYSLAQDAASAIRLFKGDFIYNTQLGIPYFNDVLGKSPSITLLKNYFTEAAETVPDVTSAVVYISAVTNGQVSGQVQVTNQNGSTSTASF